MTIHQGIVSVEVKEGWVEIFNQLASGEVQSTRTPYRYWMLSQTQHDGFWKRLKGENSYRFIKSFPTACDFWKEYRRIKNPYVIFDFSEGALTMKNLNYFHHLEFNAVSRLSFDIEASSLTPGPDFKIYLISNLFVQGSRILRKLFDFKDYPTQGAMIAAWCEWVRSLNPSFLIGHNLIKYDLPMISYVAKREGVPLKLGRDGSELTFDTYPSWLRKDGSQSYSYFNPHIYGRSVIDTMFLAIKSDTKRDLASYGLKYLEKKWELKSDQRQLYDASKINENVDNEIEWAKIRAYAEQDADSAFLIFEKLAPAYFYLARELPRSFQSIVNTASGSQINSYLVRSYLNLGQSIPEASETKPYVGANPIGNPGVRRNALKLDVNSMYSSLILDKKIYNPAKDPNGHFLKMVERFTTERLKNKALFKETGDKKYEALSEVGKIIANSAYGFMGAPKLTFNSPEHAALVCEHAREYLNRALKWCEEKGFILINSDTDSILFCKADESFIPESERETLLSELNALYPSRIRWAQDGYFDVSVVNGPKNYALKAGTTVSIKGSALKASLKEPALKELIDRVLNSLLDGIKVDLDRVRREYAAEIESDPLDIHRWSVKKTITSTVLNPRRTQERKILAALQGSEYAEGDKAYFYYTHSGDLQLRERWQADHSKARLHQKLKSTLKIFAKELLC
jgi:DNA polymerase elongation subunit (family B)